MKYICTVERIQIWRGIEVEADSEEKAKDAADEIAAGTLPNDDFANETTAKEVE